MRPGSHNPFDSSLLRRDFLRFGSMASVSSFLPGLLDAQARAADVDLPVIGPMFGRAKQVILLFLSGGPPQHETFDPKPLAPAEIRGPFKAIHTNVPGIDFSELLPRTAARADRLAVIRSMFTNNNIHGGSGYWVLTGRPLLTGDGENALPTDWPNLASIVKYLRPSQRLPALSTVTLPELFIGNGGNIESGQFGGILGPRYSPELIECRPADRNSPLGGMYSSRVSADRIQQRVSLLNALERSFEKTPRSAVVQLHEGLNTQAIELLTTGGAREAFRLEQEPDRVRDRYGRHTWGQSVLLARRLVEAGVRFVTVNWPRVPGDRGVDNPVWDTHARNFDRMEDCLAPQFDVGFSALLDDLSDRGLLDETLVIAVGEFGRTPVVNGNAGRDHWGPVFSCVLAGGGISGGQVYGSSDRQGGYPANDPVDAGHLAATVFHLVGINTQGTFPDRFGRELTITESEPLYKLLGEQPASTNRRESTGDVAFVPPYRTSLLLHPDFAETTTLPPLDAPASPKGWRAGSTGGTNAGPQVRLCRQAELPSSEMGIWTNETDAEILLAPRTNAVLAQQIRDPQSGTFKVSARIDGAGSSSESFQKIFAANFRCRLVIFQFTHPSKSVVHRQELATVEFVPQYSDSPSPTSGTLVSVEKMLAAPGGNFSFGLGIGVAVMIESRNDASTTIPPKSGDAFVRVHRIDVEFEGLKVG